MDQHTHASHCLPFFSLSHRKSNSGWAVCFCIFVLFFFKSLDHRCFQALCGCLPASHHLSASLLDGTKRRCHWLLGPWKSCRATSALGCSVGWGGKVRILLLMSQEWDISERNPANPRLLISLCLPKEGCGHGDEAMGRKEGEARIINKTENRGFWGWDWSQAAALPLPWAVTYMTPSEFPHDLTSPGVVAKRMRVTGLPQAKHLKKLAKLTAPWSSAWKEQRKITCMPITCPLPVFFLILGKCDSFHAYFLEEETLEGEGSELIGSFSTQCWLFHFFVQYFTRPLTFI